MREFSAKLSANGCEVIGTRYSEHAGSTSLLHLRFIYGTLLFLSLAAAPTQSIWLQGNPERCEVEGQLLELPFIEDPCFTCMCKNGYIQCEREVCPLYDCSYTMNQKGKCCKKCPTCTFLNRTFENKDQWLQVSDQDTCVEHICQDGVVTRAQMQCHVTCENPIDPPSATCGCPSCRGCVHNDMEFGEGETINLDSCTACVCTGGNMECKKKTCPVPACESEIQRLSADGCCLSCTGQRLLYELPEGHCWYGRGYLENTETDLQDKCTSCTCQNGTVICDRTVCHERPNCPTKEWLYDGCCPRCPEYVPLNCTDEMGRLVQHGDSWVESRDPCLTCSCQNGDISCKKGKCSTTITSCPQGQTLDKLPGSCCPQCIPESGICAVFGDPHYRSFDGTPFNFQGDCKYMLAKDCLERNFTVVVQNNARSSPHYSWTNAIHLTLIQPEARDETVVSLYQHLAVKVNGRKVSLPYVNPHLLAWVEHHMVKVRTNAGVSLNWDGDSFLEVGASNQHRGSLCGLCGNFNGFPRDDFIGGDGSFKFDKEEFARSWRIGPEDQQCTKRAVKTRSAEPCGRNTKLKVAARKACQIFKTREFRICYSEVEPLDYHRSCLTDTCECPRNRKCSCESIRAYTAACARRGVNITWEENRHCKQTCPHGKVYSPCGSPCQANCRNYRRLRRRDTCRRQCTAGCYCPAGYVTKGRKCVKISKCRRLKRKQKRVNPFLSILKPSGKMSRKKRRRAIRRRKTTRTT